MTSKSKIILLFISFLLKSCSSILSSRSNIIPITGEDLLGNGLLRRQRGMTLRDEGQPLIEELRKKIRKLEEEGFIGGADPNNSDMKKHFMFIFSHWLGYKQSNKIWTQRIPTFQLNHNAGNLVWEPRLVYLGFMPIVEFRLKSLFTNNDPYLNQNQFLKAQGNAPLFMYNGIQEIVEIDHLFRDNRVTIELPESLHHEKTRIVDNLLSGTRTPPDRDSHDYWIHR